MSLQQGISNPHQRIPPHQRNQQHVSQPGWTKRSINIIIGFPPRASVASCLPFVTFLKSNLLIDLAFYTNYFT